jgi:hypothetical protein
LAVASCPVKEGRNVKIRHVGEGDYTTKCKFRGIRGIGQGGKDEYCGTLITI